MLGRKAGGEHASQPTPHREIAETEGNSAHLRQNQSLQHSWLPWALFTAHGPWHGFYFYMRIRLIMFWNDLCNIQRLQSLPRVIVSEEELYLWLDKYHCVYLIAIKADLDRTSY